MKMLTLKVLVGVGLVASLVACATNKEEPQVNPNPQHFLTLKGYIAPELKGKLFLSFEETYSGTADQCYHTTNILAGLQEAPAKTSIYEPTIINNHYTLKIPFDDYLPGYCKWVPIALSYALTKNGVIPTINDAQAFITFSDEDQQYNPKVYNVFCTGDSPNCPVVVAKGKATLVFLKPNQSTEIEFNLLHKK